MIALLLAVAAVSAPAQDASAPAPKPDRKICRTMGTTGSLVSRKVCHTQAEWVAIDRQLSHDDAASGNDINRGTGTPR